MKFLIFSNFLMFKQNLEVCQYLTITPTSYVFQTHGFKIYLIYIVKSKLNILFCLLMLDEN